MYGEGGAPGTVPLHNLRVRKKCPCPQSVLLDGGSKWWPCQRRWMPKFLGNKRKRELLRSLFSDPLPGAHPMDRFDDPGSGSYDDGSTLLECVKKNRKHHKRGKTKTTKRESTRSTHAASRPRDNFSVVESIDPRVYKPWFHMVVRDSRRNRG